MKKLLVLPVLAVLLLTAACSWNKAPEAEIIPVNEQEINLEGEILNPEEGLILNPEDQAFIPVEETMPSPEEMASLEPAENMEEEAIFCTMDAKICADGSAVGRVAPDCEFSACPGE